MAGHARDLAPRERKGGRHLDSAGPDVHYVHVIDRLGVALPAQREIVSCEEEILLGGPLPRFVALVAVEAGFDMFDCVMPTRNARNGTLFTSRGRVSIKRAE